VNTFLTRLVEKGVLRVRREGKSNIYSPAKTREQCIRAESDSFLRRVFRGATGPMLLHFVERAELSPDEIRELERLLKQKKKP
jgi:BlaI family penicillinase repressor